MEIRAGRIEWPEGSDQGYRAFRVLETAVGVVTIRQGRSGCEWVRGRRATASRAGLGLLCGYAATAGWFAVERLFLTAESISSWRNLGAGVPARAPALPHSTGTSAHRDCARRPHVFIPSYMTAETFVLRAHPAC
jgi:hypothetical protein